MAASCRGVVCFDVSFDVDIFYGSFDVPTTEKTTRLKFYWKKDHFQKGMLCARLSLWLADKLLVAAV